MAGLSASLMSDFDAAFPVSKKLTASRKTFGGEFSLLNAYCDRLKERGTTSKSTPKHRVLPPQPDRVLDAPGLVDDFYLNVLDWSNRNILAVALGANVYLWNAVDGTVKEIYNSPTASQSASSLRWVKDGRSLAIGMDDGTVAIWDVEAGRRLRTMVISPNARVASLSWNRHLLSTGSRNGSILTHDVRIARHLAATHTTGVSESNVRSEICGLSWSPDGRRLASGSAGGSVSIWELPTTDLGTNSSLDLCGHRSAVKALGWGPYSSKLATGGGSADRSIRLWSVDGGHCLQAIDCGAQVSGLFWSRNGEDLVGVHGYDRNGITIWGSEGKNTLPDKRHNFNTEITDVINDRWAPFRQVAEISNAHDARILHLAISPDGKTVATAAADESIKFWNVLSKDSSSSEEKGTKRKRPLETL